MKMIVKRLAAVLMAIALTLTCVPALGGVSVVYAEDDPQAVITAKAGIEITHDTASNSLTWDVVDGAAEYQCQFINTALEGDDAILCTEFPTENYLDLASIFSDFYVNGLEEQTDLRVTITALDSDGTALASGEIALTYEPPAAPPRFEAEIDDEGTLTCAQVDSAVYYEVIINGNRNPLEDGVTSCDLNALIDRLITENEIEAGTTEFSIKVRAYDDANAVIGETDTLPYTYVSGAEPGGGDDPGTGEVPQLEGLTFDAEGRPQVPACDGAYTWYAYVNGTHATSWDITNVEEDSIPSLNHFIDRLIQSGAIEKSDTYPVSIDIWDEDYNMIATANGEYAYSSDAEPIELAEITITRDPDTNTLNWNQVEGAVYYQYSFITRDEEGNETDICGDNIYAPEQLYLELDPIFMTLYIDNYIEFAEPFDGVMQITALDNDGFAIGKGELPVTYTKPEVPAMTPAIDQEAGTMTWDTVEGAAQYEVIVEGIDEGVDNRLAGNRKKLSGDRTSISLKAIIDKWISDTLIPTGLTKYQVRLRAYQSDEVLLGESADMTFNYESTTQPGDLDPGEIYDLAVNEEGDLSWQPVDGAVNYEICVENTWYAEATETPFDLEAFCQDLAEQGYFSGGTLDVTVRALDANEIVIAEGTTTYDMPEQVTGEIAVTIEDGQLTFSTVPGTAYYILYVDDKVATELYGQEGRSFDLHEVLETAIKNGDVDNYLCHTLRLEAMDGVQESPIAAWSYEGVYDDYQYEGEDVPKVTDLEEVEINDGVATWAAPEGVSYYTYGIQGQESWETPLNEANFCDYLTMLALDENIYEFDIYAFNDDGQKIARAMVQYDFKVKELSNVTITGVTGTISAGKAPAWTAKTDTEGTYVSRESWIDTATMYDESPNMIISWGKDIASPNTTYRHHLMILAENGYRFPDDVTVTYNGQTYSTDSEGIEIGLRSDNTVIEISGLVPDVTTGDASFEEAVSVKDYHSDPSRRADVEEKIHLFRDGRSYDFFDGAGLCVCLKDIPSRQLEEGTDYETAYVNNDVSGTMKMTITPIGKYAGFAPITKNVKIAPVTVTYADAPFSATRIAPLEPTAYAVVDGTKVKLTYKTDYTVDYMDGDMSIGSHTTLLIGTGDYVGFVADAGNYRIVGNIGDVKVTGLGAKTYTGKAQTPKPTVKFNEFNVWKTLTKDTDYKVTIRNSAGKTVTTTTSAGTYTVIITGKGYYTGTKKLTYTINKANNTMTAAGKTAVVKYTKVKRANQTVTKANAFTIKNAKGTVTFKKASGSSKITVSSAGKITVKKGIKKGTYKVKVKITAKGDSNYKTKSLTKTVTIKVQ